MGAINVKCPGTNAGITITAALRRSLVVLLIAVNASLLAQRPLSETRVKSGVLFNIIAFSNWPEKAFKDKDETKAPVVLGVQGDPKLASSLDYFKSKRIHGRRFVVKRLDPGDSTAGCHAVYSNARRKRDLAELVKSTRGTPTLLISDASPVDALAEGIGVNLVRKKQRKGNKLVLKLRFEINSKAIKQRDLRIDSRVLRLATRVVK